MHRSALVDASPGASAAASTPQVPTASTDAPFPPSDLTAFLQLCAGEWMSLRSLFGLGQLEEGANGDEWHSSERGELVVTYLRAEHPAEPGGLLIAPKGHPERSLVFDRQGGFRASAGASGTSASAAASGTSPAGHWQLWPDGSLELRLKSGGTEVRERIWFTKPNLRLRSTVEHRSDGSPGRASFSSEIRRVSRAAAPGATAA